MVEQSVFEKMAQDIHKERAAYINAEFLNALAEEPVPLICLEPSMTLVDAGCCAMASTFGHEAQNVDN